MSAALLFVIYLSYISLGLPDTLLGAAWPAMRTGLGAGLDAAGTVSLVISLGTVVSSLLGGRLLHRFGTGPVAFFSILFTALSLWGFSAAGSFPALLALAVPLGLGAGAVDAGLNNFVALHYKPLHINLLHCFWGLGAMSGPAVMAFWIARNGRWDLGYRTVSCVQLFLVALLGLSLPLWRRVERGEEEKAEPAPLLSNWAALKLPGVKTALAAFFCYYSLEISAGLWASTYLVEQKEVAPDRAAFCVSLFYGGIAVGRLLSGLLSERFSGRAMIRTGLGLCFCGILLLPVSPAAGAVGLALLGLGCAPLYPAMLKETPARFGREASQTVMGLEIGAAYLGSTLIPLLTGFFARYCSMAVLPLFLLLAAGLILLLCERLNRLGNPETD